MPRKPTPAGKQRVRTGCLTCRKRRRKCDEQKPRCANCEVKDFPCKYGNGLAFVSPRSGAAGGMRQAYSSITFVDDSPLARAKGKSGQSKSASASQSKVTENGVANTSDETAYSDPSESRTALSIDDVITSNVPVGFGPGTTSLQHTSELLLHARDTSSSTAEHHTVPQYFSFLTSPRHIPKRQVTANTCLETDLLRHFCYHIGPWIDVGDPDRAFGIQVLLLCRACRPLQAAILALSASQRSFLALPCHEDLNSSAKFRAETEETLDMQPESIKDAGKALLLLQDLLPTGIQRWRSHIKSAGGFLASATMEEELGEATFWLHFRLDLAASVASQQPPIMPFRSFIQRDGSPINTPQSNIPPQPAHRSYSHALCLLGYTLALIHGEHEPTPPQNTEVPELAAFPSLRQSHFLSQWTFLWTDCQKWYNERPVDAQQIVDVRGGEADQIDASHTSSFPILIYTTPMALVANAVHHLTALLLLTHKPRLLKSLPGPRCFTSHIWHAQSIAGIAASNDSPEQWDPILVAGLLLIARDMTHESQQRVLLECLTRVTATTGINLERETEALQSIWSIARYDEEPED